MSKKKLTLTIEETYITRAKSYAKKTNSSLSQLIEDYLSEINPIMEVSDAKLLRGIASKARMADKSDVEIKEMYRKERFGI